MRVVLTTNPRSGVGRADRLASAARGALESRAATVVEAPCAKGPAMGVLGPHLRGADALVVVGGDGTVRWAAEAARETSTPVYHMPTGTENLFAREWGMRASVGSLLRALDRRDVRRMDLGVCNGDVFTLMVSVGPDAGVIHRLDERRNGTISHLSYVAPTIAEALSPRVGPVTVEIDGERVVDGGRGLLVVGNCRQYAVRVDPAKDADPSDGLLDVVFFPGRDCVTLLGWAAASRVRAQRRGPGLVYRRGREVVVRRDARRSPVQFDGEAFGTHVNGVGEVPASERELRITVQAGALPVLAPSGG
jgi:diacylglycerol kinase family enzyme